MKHKIESYIRLWENRCYSSGIPDEADEVLESFNKVPSYRRIVKAILKNDVSLKSLGFSPKKSTYYAMLKRIEFEANNKPIQLKLW